MTVRIDPATGERIEESKGLAIDPETGERIANPGNTKPEVSRGPDLSKVGTGEAMARSALPRSFQAAEEGAGVLRQAGAGALDALSLPGRTLASVASAKTEGNPYAYAMGGSFGLPKEAQRFEVKSAEPIGETEGKGAVSRTLRDPALLPGLLTGGAAARTVGRLGLSGLKAASAAGGLLGAESAAIHQADNAAQGREVDLGSAATETALGAALPAAAAGVGKVAKLANKALGRLAESLSGVSEDALRTHGAGFGQGAKDLAEAAGKQGEIGKKLVDALDNLDDYLPEKTVVDRALMEMPAVNVSNTLAALEKAKTGGVLSSSKATNDKIQGLISDIAGAADETGNIPAATFRSIRKEIDELVGDAFGKESGKYVSALKQARHQMAADLVESAKASGRPEYVEAMQSMADKLQKADKLSSFLGKSATTRENRAESFISTLFGKNKTERQEAVKAMGEIFGEDFLSQARLANLAAELGPGGKAGLLPQQFTGRSALGPGLAALSGSFVAPSTAALPLALSSPRLAGAVLSGSGAVSKGLSSQSGQRGLSTFGRAVGRPFFRGLDEDQNP